ncbi:MAG: class I SAM-dependent methyltransferase, partial [Chitinophagaceae bacterium]
IRITLLNLEAVPVKNQTVFTSVQGDATDLSAWADKSVDLVFSNSVIEHLFTWAQQQKMASEVQRVGRSYFIQTPNRYFPMEPHWLIPFFQFMPRSIRIALTRSGAWGHMPRLSDNQAAAKLVDEVRLLTASEMKTLFPAAHIYYEYMFGMVKSVSAYHIATPQS